MEEKNKKEEYGPSGSHFIYSVLLLLLITNPILCMFNAKNDTSYNQLRTNKKRTMKGEMNEFKWKYVKCIYIKVDFKCSVKVSLGKKYYVDNTARGNI